MRGRKPIPTSLKIVRGNPGHRPLPPDEPKPPSGIPQCPKHLDKEARKIWRKTTKILFPIGITTKIDVTVLARWCQGAANLVRINEEQYTIKNPEKKIDDLTVRAVQYRVEYERWNHARIETAKGLFKLEGNKFIENPYLKIERQSFIQMRITEDKIKSELRAIDDQMRKDEIEMGMTPSSRTRVKAVEVPPQEEDKKERFFR